MAPLTVLEVLARIFILYELEQVMLVKRVSGEAATLVLTLQQTDRLIQLSRVDADAEL